MSPTGADRGAAGGQGVDDLDRGHRWVRRDIRAAASASPQDVAARANRRLGQLVRHARTHSPLFGDLYGHLDDPTVTLTDLPVTTKPTLMAAFDDWATDRRVTRAAAEEFASKPENVGGLFLGEYLYSETSGTTGVPGSFVTEDDSLTVSNALAARVGRLPATTMLRGATKRGRVAAVINKNGHHMGAVFYTRSGVSPTSSRVRYLSVHDPLSTVTAALNAFDPATVNSYATTLAILAAEHLAGRLRIDPAVLMPISETVTPAVSALIAQAWPRAHVIERYAANEAMTLSSRCPHGWHHLNADWLILEPIDATGGAVAPGTPSHSVLLTNLHRRVQPIIRYDLGDSILMRPDRCACGNTLPAFQVVGRAGEILYFTIAGERRGMAPIAFATDLEDIPGVLLSQVLRDGPMHVTLRLSTEPGVDRGRATTEALSHLTALFADAGLGSVGIDLSDDAPQLTDGGKLRRALSIVDD